MLTLARRPHAPVSPSDASPARRVLVVDEAGPAAHLAAVLRLGGHEAHTAHDAASALEAARTLRPAFIFLDAGLPGPVSGYDLAPRLRELPGLDSVLLVALTGQGGEEARRRALAAGFDARLGKPADREALHALLGVGRREQSRPAA